jgi:signal transduction histidine kinase
MTEHSHFARPDRSAPEEIKSESDFLTAEKTFLDIFGSFANIAAILDKNRQIIYGNEVLLKMLGVDSLEQILGKRPGEVIFCVHSEENPYGCGTSEACKYCGAVNAIISSQKTGKKEIRDARITSSIDGKMKSLELRVSSAPLKINGREFYIFTVQDISDEKRKEMLERIFLHDLINSASNLKELLTLLNEETDENNKKELLEISEKTSSDIVEEILFHRKMIEAERGELMPDMREYSITDLVTPVINKITSDSIANGKKVLISELPEILKIETDYVLFNRVLTNLLKNALEACDQGEKVILHIMTSDQTVKFIVSNNREMPAEVKHQVFQRSFSTKGVGRGFGTYSVKLISESYLKGKVSFVSTADSGTSFTLELPVSGK